jgi:tetratricopeptide (TPR) repeat protein
MCREQLPVWQKFYEENRHRSFELLAIAMDAQGPQVARRFTESAGVTFPAAIDRAQGLWELYNFAVIPNGFFVDERGILRYANIGGFDARNPADVAEIEAFLDQPSSPDIADEYRRESVPLAEALAEAEAAVSRDPENFDLRLELGERLVEAGESELATVEFDLVLEQRPESVRAWMGLASAYLDMGEREGALEALRKAWALEPDNWIIRKQIWAVEHPEEFYPAINPRWQQERIREEESRKKR